MKPTLLTVAGAIVLLSSCFTFGVEPAESFRVDFSERILREDVVHNEREFAVATPTIDALSNFNDPPGATAPEDPELTRRIPGGGPDDLYPDFGGIVTYANNKGSFRTHLATGMGGGPGNKVENKLLLVWSGDYIKSAGDEPFRFTVNPGVLRLVDSRSTVASDNDLEASWRLTAKVEGITQFEVIKRLHGKGSFSSIIEAVRNNEFRNNYVMVEDSGPIEGELTGFKENISTPDGTIHTYIGGQFKTPKYSGTLDLDGIGPGESFTVTYELEAHAVAYGPDTVAEASCGDPLDYSGGVNIEYGEYGDIFRITDFEVDQDGRSLVRYPSEADYYYVLCAGEDVTGIEPPLALQLGGEGTGELVDERPAGLQQRAFYLVKRVHSTAPLDSDGDGIDDWYELNRSAILDPLNQSDALLDTDEDGRSARQEYLDETDPETSDEGPNIGGLYPAVTFAMGGGSELETADVNNDGIADLAILNGAAISFVFGNADGSFAPPFEFVIPDGGQLGDILFDHLDADEFPDLVFADESNSRVEILFGDGQGGFASKEVHAVDDAPRRVVLAQVNTDGHVDIITLNNTGNSISILLGDGDGTVQSPTTIDIGFSPTDAAVALLNDDEHPDLVVTLVSGGSQVGVLLNNGDGTFAPPVLYPTGISPQRVAAGDLNGDGIPDIVTSNQTGDGVSVLLGKGDGTLLPKVDHATGDNPRGLLLVDLNEDTNPDLLVAHVGANHHSVLLNDGSGGFDPAQPVPTSSGNQNCLLVDIDRDGLADIVSRVNQRATVSHGLPGGGFDTRTQITLALGFSPRDFEVADLNGDGRRDIVVSNGGNNNTVDGFLGREDGGFDALPSLAVGEKVEGLAVARLNAGPVPDLAVVTQRPEFFPGDSANELHILLGDGAGSFASGQVIDLHAAPKEVFVGDFEGNGIIGILVAFNVTGELQLFVNNGSGFSGQTPVKLADAFGGASGTRVVGDFDGDGRADIAAVRFNGEATVVTLLESDGEGVLTVTDTITPSGDGFPVKVAAGDVNGDGLPDLVVSVNNPGGASLVMYPGTKDGPLGAEQLLVEGFSGDIAIADVNGDGLPDLLGGATVLLAEEGGGYAAPLIHFLPGANTSPVAVGDIDGDGRPDLITTDDLGDAVTILPHR